MSKVVTPLLIQSPSPPNGHNVGGQMSHFFINNFAQPDGNHEVHLLGCTRMPTDKRYLGNYYSVSEALIEARKEFWQSGGCERCARERPVATSVGRIVAGSVPAWGRFR